MSAWFPKSSNLLNESPDLETLRHLDTDLELRAARLRYLPVFEQCASATEPVTDWLRLVTSGSDATSTV